MARPVTRSDRARYAFDDYMSRGSRSSFASLTITFVLAFLLVAGLRVAAVAILGDVAVERGDSGWRQVYVTFLELTDPGSMTQDVDSSPWVKVFAVVSGLFGLVLLSSLIALLTTAVDSRLKELRKGHSRVVLTGHTLILGWNDRVLDVIRELVLANESEDDPSVVILADKPKEEMDDFLALRLPDTLNTKVVTRSGTTSALVSLGVVAVESCKSAIVLAGCNIGARPAEKGLSDIEAIKTLLAVVSSIPAERPVPIVAEIFGKAERTLAEAIDEDRVVCIDADDVLAKIIVQTSRSSGLAVVYEEMLSFDGAELYFYEAEWGGVSFGEALYRFSDGVALGLLRDGDVKINPPSDTRLAQGDELLILASDDSAISFDDTPIVNPNDGQPTLERLSRHVERQLIIGFGPKLETIAKEYADYVLPSSSIDVVLREPSQEVRTEIERIDAELTDLDIRVVSDEAMSSEALIALRPFDYDNIIILSQAARDGDEGWTDSETLVILLQLQRIFRSRPEDSETKLIAEILDSRNRELVAHTGVKEFIISNSLISMMVAQISENRSIRDVYDNLFAEDGSEIYLKDAEIYFDELPLDKPFGDIMAAANARDEIALGVKHKRDELDATANFGVALNPDKQRTIRLEIGDSIVVISEDET